MTNSDKPVIFKPSLHWLYYFMTATALTRSVAKMSLMSWKLARPIRNGLRMRLSVDLTAAEFRGQHQSVAEERHCWTLDAMKATASAPHV